MTFGEIRDAFERQTACEFYSSGKGWVAWLDEGWHAGIIVALDEAFPSVTLHICGAYDVGTLVVEVRGKDDIANLLRCPCRDACRGAMSDSE